MSPMDACSATAGTAAPAPAAAPATAIGRLFTDFAAVFQASRAEAENDGLIEDVKTRYPPDSLTPVPA
jgi:hypothetical protein